MFQGFGNGEPAAPDGPGASTATRPLFDPQLGKRLLQIKAAQAAQQNAAAACAQAGQGYDPTTGKCVAAPPAGGDSTNRDLPSYEENKTLYYVIGGVALVGVLGAVLYFSKRK